MAVLVQQPRENEIPYSELLKTRGARDFVGSTKARENFWFAPGLRDKRKDMVLMIAGFKFSA
jgi:hypothetical protein